MSITKPPNNEIIGEKLVIREYKKWEKRNKLVAKLLKKKINGMPIESLKKRELLDVINFLER